ncbi:MAG: hypothetical protein J6X07_05980 [Prevotella sp.]|nr:hypothetical protein [Prevotella sp.]
MKKYLMTGIAALALCVGFTSCSHDLEALSQEEIDQLEAQKVVEKYNRAFIATFGQPAANQNWGFGSTRTRTENANANEWADPDKEYGGLLVPPAITPTQAAVVKAYFQNNPDLDYDDPRWSNYFIQQVYKGNPETAGAYSPEQYLAADGENYILASDHMDHLLAIDPDRNFVDHINNFNHGDCSPNGDVLNNGEHVGGAHHTDKIMYMMNSTTKSFAYHNSDGSLYHTEYTGLVSWETIHDWAIENYDGYDGCLNDTWNRSYMGFDFEQIVGDDVYSVTKNVDYQAAWRSPDQYEEGVEYVDGFPVISVTYNTFMFEGKTYNYLITNRNQYAADKNETSFIGKYNNKVTTPGIADFDNEPNNDVKRELLEKGYLPVDGTADKTWVKVGGTADGYFSDWIVTLTEAKTPGPGPTPDPFVADLRIMAEDLSATEKSDYDFNDIVFDVQFNRAATETTDAKPARILVRAAGGTLPLRIKVKSSASSSDPTYTGKDGNGWQEVHALWNKSTGIMINTNATQRVSPSKGYEANYDLDPIELDYDVADAADAKNITIEVLKGGQWIEMRAEVGMPAAKFACTPDHVWAEERVSLSGNSNFEEWVQGKAAYWQWY